MPFFSGDIADLFNNTSANLSLTDFTKIKNPNRKLIQFGLLCVVGVFLKLLQTFFVGYSQFVPSSGPSGCQHPSSVFGRHSGSETMFVGSFST